MKSYIDLVERLLKYNDWMPLEAGLEAMQTVGEARRAIERLALENEELRAELAALTGKAGQ
jgi:hypothetical protein